MTQATELRELASLIHVDGSNSYVGVSSTAFTPTDAFVVKDDGARITVESATREVAMLGRRGSSGVALESGYLRLRNQGVTADGVVLDSDNNSWINGGNLGLGTSSPNALLHLKTTDGSSVIQQLETTGGTVNRAWKNFVSGSTGYYHIQDATAPANRITVDTSGNVGIGTTDPDYKLDVTGGGRFTVDLRLGSENLRLSTDGSGEFGLGYGSTHTTANRIRVYQNTTPVFTVRDDGAIDTAQVRHSIAPTLNLDFANSKQLDSRITFYRDSIATYYDSRGTLRYANHNEPRFDHDPVTGESKGLLIEEDRTNLITSSTNMLSSIWGTSATYTSIIPNSVLSPSGKYDSASIIETTDNNSHRHLTDPPISTLSGTTATYSAFVKPIGPNTRHIYFMAQDGTNGFYAHFNMSNGTVHQDITGNGTGTGTDAGIVSVGNGWYRIWITGSISSTAIYHQLYFETTTRNGFSPDSYTGDGQSGFAVWGYQVEAGAFPTSYIPSDTRFTSRSSAATYHDETGILRTAPADGARYGYKYDGRKWVETGLILEKAATNLQGDSNAFDPSTAWNKDYSGQATTLLSGYSSPAGSNNATYFTRTSGAGTGRVGALSRPNTPSITIGQDYTNSFYVKSDGNVQYARMSNVDAQSGNDDSKFDIINGTIHTLGSNCIASIENVGNGWYRCSVAKQNVASTGGYHWIFADDVAEGNGIYVFGSQQEAGLSVSSFIYTAGSVTTRSADVVSSTAYTREADTVKINGKNKVEEWYVPGQGTLYAEGISGDQDTYFPGFIELNKFSSGSNDRIHIFGRPSGIISFQVIDDGDYSAIISTLTGNMRTENIKVALAFQEDDFAFTFSNNTTVYTDTSGTIPDINYVSIGEQNGGYMNGTIKKIVYYPERLSNVELQALTENN